MFWGEKGMDGSLLF